MDQGRMVYWQGRRSMGNIGEAQTSKSHLLVRPIYRNGPQWQNIGEARASKLQWIDAPDRNEPAVTEYFMRGMLLG